MKVTICIPTYERHKLLRDLVTNIVSNVNISYTYEILLLNDSHFIDQKKVCQELEDEHEVVRYVQNPKNLGLFRNLENNFDHIKGEYVIFPGDDDCIYPELINKQVSLLDLYSGVVMVAPLFNISYVKEGLNIKKKVDWKEDYKIFNGLEVVKNYLGENQSLKGKVEFVWPSIMFRKNSLSKVGHFKDATRVAGDTYVISKVLTQGNYCQINKLLFDFKNYGNSLRSSSSKEGRAFIERYRMIENLESFMKESQQISLEEEDINSFYRKLAAQTLSYNGSLTWMAAHYEGNYFSKVKLIISTFVKCVKLKPMTALNPTSYVVFLASLIIPRKGFTFLFDLYARFKN